MTIAGVWPGRRLSRRELFAPADREPAASPCNAARRASSRLESSRASAGELQNILDKSSAFAALPRVKRTPAFRLERIEPAQYDQQAKGKQWSYICDGNERIGLITTWLNHVELFRFFPPGDGKGAKHEVPEVYHWANLFGSRLQMYGKELVFTNQAELIGDVTLGRAGG